MKKIQQINYVIEGGDQSIQAGTDGVTGISLIQERTNGFSIQIDSGDLSTSMAYVGTAYCYRDENGKHMTEDWMRATINKSFDSLHGVVIQ